VTRQSALLFLGVLVLASACAGRMPGTPLSFSTVEQGNSSGIREPTRVVVRTAREWLVVWARHVQAVGAVMPPPVDFSREMVVGVFLGQRETGGDQIEITGVEKTATVLRVQYQVREPEPGAVLTQVLTQPFHLVRLARDDAFVSFIRESGAR
jgi:hypothetical protein